MHDEEECSLVSGQWCHSSSWQELTAIWMALMVFASELEGSSLLMRPSTWSPAITSIARGGLGAGFCMWWLLHLCLSGGSYVVPEIGVHSGRAAHVGGQLEPEFAVLFDVPFVGPHVPGFVPWAGSVDEYVCIALVCVAPGFCTDSLFHLAWTVDALAVPWPRGLLYALPPIPSSRWCCRSFGWRGCKYF